MNTFHNCEICTVLVNKNAHTNWICEECKLEICDECAVGELCPQCAEDEAKAKESAEEATENE